MGLSCDHTMWTVPKTGIAGGEVWAPQQMGGPNDGTAWGESIEESSIELKKKLEKSKAENSELQRLLIQLEVQMLSAQVSTDAFVDNDQVPEIVAELARQNQEYKEQAEKEKRSNAKLRAEIALMKQNMEAQGPRLETVDEVNLSQIDDLQRYIRSQAKEYVEGNAESSTQIAELRLELSDFQQKLAQVKRERDEIRRNAEAEIRSLQTNGNVTEKGTDSPLIHDSNDYARLREKWAIAEDRVAELEAYIRGNPAAAPKDIRDVLIQTSFELKNHQNSLEQLRQEHQKVVEFWDQCSSRLVATIQKHLVGRDFDRSPEKQIALDYTDQRKDSKCEVLPLCSASVTSSSMCDVLYSVLVDLRRFRMRVENWTLISSLNDTPGSQLCAIAGSGMGRHGGVSQEALTRHAAIQKNLDELKSSRKEIACCVMQIEKGLRDIHKELTPQVSELLGRTDPIKDRNLSKEAIIGLALTDASNVIPLSESSQIKGLCTLLQAEYSCDNLLASFVELPKIIKRMFDLSKEMISQDEVNNLLRDVQEVQRTAKAAENRHNFHVTLLQRRFEAMSKRWSSFGRLPKTSSFSSCEIVTTDNKTKAAPLAERRVKSEPFLGPEISDDSGSVAGSEDMAEGSEKTDVNAGDKAVRAHIRSIMKQMDAEDQFVNLGMSLKHNEQQLKEHMARLDQLEEHIVDLHVSRYQQKNNQRLVEKMDTTTAPWAIRNNQGNNRQQQGSNYRRQRSNRTANQKQGQERKLDRRLAS